MTNKATIPAHPGRHKATRTRLTRAGRRRGGLLLAWSVSLLLSLSALPMSSTSASETIGAESVLISAGNDPIRTKFGSTIWSGPGDNLIDGMQRQRQRYGDLGAVRIFDAGMPSSWSNLRSAIGDTPAVVSFKADPGAVLSGKLDSQFRSWFANAPTDTYTRWSYYHEPEDDGERGALNLERYRAAWRHVSVLANQANNPRLRATLILMCWTLKERSGRNWRDYYAGDDFIDVIAYDCYNAGHREGRYGDPANHLEPAADLSRRIGKPWGVAELGSVLISGDTQGRAAWLRRATNFAADNDARFVTYFDTDIGADYRLLDSPSQQAWREAVQSS